MPGLIVRSLLPNLFDQYSARENRLTQALLYVLAFDPALLLAFLDSAGSPPPRGSKVLVVSAQSFPGDPNRDDASVEEDPISRGVPDGWICDEDVGWAVLLESKITAPLAANQLIRHVRQARRRGFEQITVLALTPDEQEPDAVQKARREVDAKWQSWPSLYLWLARQHSRDAVERLVSQLKGYLELMEGQLMEEGIDLSLTTFLGIPFGESEDYRPLKAKVLTRQLTRLITGKARNVFPHIGEARGAIRPGGKGVWDVVPLPYRQEQSHFTKVPHLTIWIGNEDTGMHLTVPDKASDVWRVLLGIPAPDVRNLLLKFQGAVREAASVLARTDGPPEPIPFVQVHQRHWPHRSKPPIQDVMFRLNLDSIVSKTEQIDPGVKEWPQWADLFAQSIASGTGSRNVEFQVGVRYPYRPGTVAHTAGFPDHLVEAILPAFRPIWERLRSQ